MSRQLDRWGAPLQVFPSRKVNFGRHCSMVAPSVPTGSSVLPTGAETTEAHTLTEKERVVANSPPTPQRNIIVMLLCGDQSVQQRHYERGPLRRAGRTRS